MKSCPIVTGAATVAIAIGLLSPAAARAADGITAVYSRASGDYTRTTLADGSFQSETYAFGKGGYYGAAIRDATIDNLSFMDVAHAIAGPLATQGYLSSRDPNATRLLIMVYWGATDGSMDFGSLNIATGRHGRGNGAGPYGGEYAGGAWGLSSFLWGPSSTQAQMTDARNAALLGYSEGLADQGSRARRERGDLLEEIEFSRYFVVLMAYDFPQMWRHRQHKLLWEARFSVREQGNDFAAALPAMAQYASEYFGKDSHGLLRTRVPDGRIYMGDPTVIEYLFEPER
jgi:hypothetical protein